MSKHIFHWAIFMSLATGFVACSLFGTRDPELPTQTSSTFVPPNDPATVLDNLVYAIREANKDNYLKCLSDEGSFRFEPSTKAGQGYGGVFLNGAWTLKNEQRYFEKLKSRLQAGDAMSLEIRSRTSVALGHDSVQYDITYRLLVPHGVATTAKDVRGQALFILAANQSSIWSIQRWVDVAQAPADSTWSDIKGAFGL